MAEKPKVAISSDFFTAFARLPKVQHAKVSKFVTNFEKNPNAKGINYEKIANATDKNMRSVRIDQTYRGIVLNPGEGDVYILLWVDHHDAAYDWAMRRQCDINPATGSIQVYEAKTRAGEPAVAQPPASVPGVFDALKDKELVRLGVPEALLPLVKQVTTEGGLDQIENRLPVEAYEGLYLYLAGSRYDEIINEREPLSVPEVDTDDFEKALDRSESRSRFVVVEDELELAAMLNAPLDRWRVFLHPSQYRLVRGTKNGPVRVLGGAGTGKTVVAMHRAKWLAENVATDTKKVLFTTFTRNLATDLEENLRSICTPEQMSRIEVVNLDRWVTRFLRKRKYDYSIAFGKDAEPFWQRALDLKPANANLPDAFFREEWQRVIQPQSIETVDQYKRASRIGRGIALSRSMKVAIWPVFEEYRNQLTIHKKKEVDDAYRDAACLLEHERGVLGYVSVIVDEAQDMGTQAFLLLRKIVPEGANDLFIVGDGHQRIYGRNRVVLGRCGINIRGRSSRLTINYRTTEEIRRWAVSLLEGCSIDDLDGGWDTTAGYKALTHGDQPELRHFETWEQQAGFIVDLLGKSSQDGSPLSHTCAVARIRREVDAIVSFLDGEGIRTQRIEANGSDHGNPEAVRVATMHRVKGLEFDRVILASINDGVVPLQAVTSDRGDPVEARQADLEERSLLYVSVTRAKKEAYVLSYGTKSPYLQSPS
ncbi:MAG: AAA family ATPase [Gammaproteobacteria bacterium]|jgi:superfamily I DNA/RNA helicase/mRNA-degrading endonuclease RelE of RelBE toxin-antitoxin system|nr:AAA family ATPase [Gammaproteobacteria bacterium]